ncbi:MAG: nitroreductase family protein [Thermotogota bacterium]|nr:nitroreductase family protein [Thermotogota bacterium]
METEITLQDILKRKSVRAYKDIALTQGDIDSIKSLFGSIRNISVNLNWKISSDTPVGSGCIYAQIEEKNNDNLVDYGFQGQQILMLLFVNDYGTCWMAKSPEKNVPAIITFGFPKDKKSLKSRISRYISQGDKRKPLNVLYEKNVEELNKSQKKLLEAIRWSPSSLNRQPWKFKFTEKGKKLILKSSSPINLGIALSNAYMAALSIFGKAKVEKVEDNVYALTVRE